MSLFWQQGRRVLLKRVNAVATNPADVRWMQTSAAAASRGIARSPIGSALTRSTMVGSTCANSVSLWNSPLGALRSFASKKHKNILRQCKGFRGRSKNCFKIAIRRLHKSWQHAYIDRRRKKRNWRKLWIMKVNAGVRQYSWSYSKFINALSKTGIILNRKIMSDLAAHEPFTMKALVDTVASTSRARKAAEAMVAH
uniref:50S ribosomal protein L20 n=1 Tax=Entomoneis paludosa TaxID=265537 RepID=A0A7S2YDD4_9STRA|mmetsp:Transcript_28375/g.59288  ORF Transcript_28375/g.59288 Transcript_28375/m.59288 type:complete len:197 (+) Transcript_28375:89-679(+)